MENRVPRPIFSYLVLSFLLIASFVSSGGFYEDVDITWGDGRGKIEEGGNVLSLSLDRTSGSGFQSKIEFLFGRFDVQMKLVPNNSAGTVTTLYLTSQGQNHDEIDLEFLGNLSGDPYTLHTNVYTQGKGEREQQFQLWFDPTADYHTYSIVWNPHRIIIFVDNIPIREFANKESIGIPYPKAQPMRIYGSLWDGDQWATRGGQVKTDWSNAPFLAHYRNYNAQTTDSKGSKDWMNVELDATGRKLLRWVQKYHMIYNYCTDRTRHHDRRECRRS